MPRRAVPEWRRAVVALVLALGAGGIVAGCRPTPMRMTSAGGETRAGAAVPPADGDEGAMLDERDAAESDADEASSAADAASTPEVTDDERPRRRRGRRGRRGRRRGR